MRPDGLQEGVVDKVIARIAYNLGVHFTLELPEEDTSMIALYATMFALHATPAHVGAIATPPALN